MEGREIDRGLRLSHRRGPSPSRDPLLSKFGPKLSLAPPDDQSRPSLRVTLVQKGAFIDFISHSIPHAHGLMKMVLFTMQS